jgi:far upstream element-binding protein
MVQDRIRAAGGGGSSFGGGSSGGGGGNNKDVKVNEAVAAGHQLLQVQVPDADVGLIIGKGGTTIKTIQDTTGASIQIPPTGNPDDPSMRTVSITHPNEAGALEAKQHIERLLESKPSYAKNQGQQTTLQILVSEI